MSSLWDTRTHPEKTRDALTPSMIKNIKKLFEKCEYCNKKFAIRYLHVHHISQVATANGSRDKNVPSNLIVLCQFHHTDARDGLIQKQKLKDKIRIRSDKQKIELKKILREREKVVDNNTIHVSNQMLRYRQSKVNFSNYKQSDIKF